MSDIRRTIERELANAYEWGKASATSGTLTTKEQVVESGIDQIARAIRLAIEREAHEGRLHEDMSPEDEAILMQDIAASVVTNDPA